MKNKKARKCHCMCHPFQKKPYMSNRNMAECKHCSQKEGE